MSKLYDIYENLKKKDKDTVYLFKSGIFYIALDSDARKLSNIFNFKLSNLNDSVIKCGFPSNSLNKYLNLFRMHNIPVEIIEDNTIYSLKEYSQSSNLQNIISYIKKADIENFSISESYSFIEKLKELAEDL